MSPLDAENIAEFCLLVRKRRELSMRDFADEIGMSFVTVSRVENGQAELPAKYIKSLRPYLSPQEWSYIKEMFWDEV